MDISEKRLQKNSLLFTDAVSLKTGVTIGAEIIAMLIQMAEKD